MSCLAVPALPVVDSVTWCTCPEKPFRPKMATMPLEGRSQPAVSLPNWHLPWLIWKALTVALIYKS